MTSENPTPGPAPNVREVPRCAWTGAFRTGPPLEKNWGSGDVRLQDCATIGANVRGVTIYFPNGQIPVLDLKNSRTSMFRVALESCQDLGTTQCAIRMFRKQPVPHSVIIGLEVDEVRDVRPKTLSHDDCKTLSHDDCKALSHNDCQWAKIDERCCTPISLPIDDRCSTPTNFPIQSTEARCCTPPTFPIKFSEGSCTPLTIPMNSRGLKMDIPLAPIREMLIAKPTRVFNSEGQTRRGWTGSLELFMSGNVSLDSNG
jgi:hypothetical protein